MLDRFDNDHSFAAGSPESTAKQSAVHTISLIATRFHTMEPWLWRGRSAHDCLPLSPGGRAAFLIGLMIDEMALLVEVVLHVAWTEANFCNDFICLNRSIARSRRRNGGGCSRSGCRPTPHLLIPAWEA